MLRITVELVPGGDESRKRVMHVAEIWNNVRKTQATGGQRGDYGFRLLSRHGRVWRQGGVDDFPRLRLGAWDLLFRVLRCAVGDRNQ